MGLKNPVRTGLGVRGGERERVGGKDEKRENERDEIGVTGTTRSVSGRTRKDETRKVGTTRETLQGAYKCDKQGD